MLLNQLQSLKCNVVRKFVQRTAKLSLRSRFASVLLLFLHRTWSTLSGAIGYTEQRANELERQLFGGFSSHALLALKNRHQDPDTGLVALFHISRTLWQWHRMHGQHEQALQILMTLAHRDPRTAATYDFHLLSLPTMIDAGLASEAIKDGAAAIARFGESTEIEFSIAMAHLALGDEPGALAWLNRTYDRRGLARLHKQDAEHSLSLANLAADAEAVTECNEKLSVIIPAHNCAKTLSYALPSVQQQAWTNLEIIVIDDCSSDDTWRLIQNFAANDARIVPLRNDVNRGAYYCRNRGLRLATGELVTVHDSDDWSHPQKFAAQIARLHAKGNLCNVSMRIRVTRDFRKGIADRPASLEVDFPSLLLRKEKFALLGGWDEVRVAADRELLNRLAIAFGERPERVCNDVPLAFGLASPLSLTGDPFAGFASLGYGARKEYQEAHRSWHQIEAARRAPDFRLPRHPRPFPVPNIIRSDRREMLSYRTILVSDFSNSCSINLEIVGAAGFAERGAVMHWPCIANAQRPFNARIRKTLIDTSIPTLVYGDHATCQTILVSNPRCLLHVPDRLAQIVAEDGIILIRDGLDKVMIEENFLEVFGLRPCFIDQGGFTNEVLV
jgi:glycosyltransferase involved in cell wall biosynthesis